MNIETHTSLWRDENEKIRLINHNQGPVIMHTESPRQAAQDYFTQFAAKYEIDEALLHTLNLKPGKNIQDEKASFRIETEKRIMDTITITYAQTYFSLPVWEAGFTVVMEDHPLRVISSSSSAYNEIEVKKPSDAVIKDLKLGKERSLESLVLPVNGKKRTGKNEFNILKKRLLIYRYDAHERVDEHRPVSHKPGSDTFKQGPLTLPLPKLPPAIKNGNFYVVEEILFSYSLAGFEDLKWRAFIEVETGAVLYLRALVAYADGYVFKADPMTANGVTDTADAATNTNATLNPLKQFVTLPGLVAPVGGQQSLTGDYITVVDITAPNLAPPTQPSPYLFDYDVRTDEFSAVNAYYHCDGFFRMISDMGFPASYFGTTTFPARADHRAGSGVNAFAFPNGTGGFDKFEFWLATTTNSANPIGMAVDWRVVLHEFGHAVLSCHVVDWWLGFAHSCGDSFAVILNDPGNQAADRFASFPWIPLISGEDGTSRRHDRTVGAGWAWGGTMDNQSYNSEQILSTTMFRIYRSIGGDHWSIDRQKLAARFTVYLILKAVGTLTQASNPTNALGFEVALENADAGSWTSVNPAESHAGGAYHKVIRWAFEKQGLFQPAGAPTPVTTEGAAPAVDVYINDGRNGEYQFIANHWSCQDIWNRRTTPGDGGGIHEEPVVGTTNYAWVKIKNRGTTTATNIVVKGYHCKPGVGLTYPDDWQNMTTNQLVASNLAPGAEIIVGPFEWTPSQVGHECLFMSVSALGDAANIDGRITGSIPEWRLVPNDNNIGQRNVVPVAGGGGIRGLVASFIDLPFWAKNPFDKNVKITLEPVLPKFLVEKGWSLEFTNPGGASFSLQPKAEREINMTMKAGKDFTADEVKNAKGDDQVVVNAYADGILIGGMTYALDPTKKMPYKPVPGNKGEHSGECTSQALQLIKCLNLDEGKIQSVQVKKVTIEINFKEEDGC